MAHVVRCRGSFPPDLVLCCRLSTSDLFCLPNYNEARLWPGLVHIPMDSADAVASRGCRSDLAYASAKKRFGSHRRRPAAHARSLVGLAVYGQRAVLSTMADEYAAADGSVSLAFHLHHF